MALYEPPDPSAWHFLTGATLLQICLGQYQLILNFHEHISLSVECGMTVARSDGSPDQLWIPDTPFIANDMFALIGSDVTDYQILPDASLRLVFGESGQITIKAENNGYESYNINYFDGSNNLWVI